MLSAKARSSFSRRLIWLTIFLSIFSGFSGLLYSYAFRNIQSMEAPLSHERIHTECDSIASTNAKRVAIIGAGSGGASTAYWLSRYSTCNPLNITVYEKSSYTGGRSTTVNVYDDPYQAVELGASIFVKANQVLYTTAQLLGLPIINAGSERPKESPQNFGVWDGSTFKFIQPEGTNYYWDIAKLLWKYGLSPVRTQQLMKATTGKFFKMYKAPTFPFVSLTQAAWDLGLAEATSVTGDVFLESNNVLPPFSTDIIQASTRVNYAQNLPTIHGLETMVCMATDGAMAIQGGNWQIFDGMLEASGAQVSLNTTVNAISKQSDSTYTIQASESHSAPKSNEASRPFDAFSPHSLIDTYDAVILAAPHQFASLTLPPTAHTPDPIPYVSLHVTLFASPHKISPIAFALSAGSLTPETILTTLPPAGSSTTPPPFYSISTLRTVTNTHHNPPRIEYLYKIFSPTPANDSLVTSLLGLPLGLEVSEEDVSWVHRKRWDSYPVLHPRVTFEELKLDEGLWYTSGVESFISTMETSALMGMNVARLIVDGWMRKEERKEKEGL